jgi:lysophospholipase L1-like esterase
MEIRVQNNRHLNVLLFALFAGAGCNSPSAPTPPAPPVAEAPEIICPAAMTVSSPSTSGTAVTFSVPEVRKGQGTVSVACTPASGTTFAVGETPVQCVATDSLSRTSSCTFAVTVAGPPRLRASRIMAFGDSLTDGQTILSNDPYDLSAPPGVSYPAQLQQLLSARYTGQTITVVNAGLPGEQASKALPRFAATFASVAPEVVVLQEGYNDYRQADNEVTGIANAVAGISQLAREARQRGARVFICTLAPGRPGRIQIQTSVLEYTNDRLREVARAEGAVLVDLYAALLPDVLANVSIDGLHLTPQGYRRVAETVFAAIRADLEVR